MHNIQNVLDRMQQIQNRFSQFTITWETKSKKPKSKGPELKDTFKNTLTQQTPNKAINQPQATQITIQNHIQQAAKKHKVPESLISAIIKNESDYNPWAVSSKGAQGLMQLMPGTAKELGVLQPFDIGQNINGGTKYLKQLLKRYDGNYAKAIAAYNAGPSNVITELPNFKETKSYVKKVMDSYLKNLGVN